MQGKNTVVVLGAGASRGVSYADDSSLPSPLDFDFFDLLRLISSVNQVSLQDQQPGKGRVSAVGLRGQDRDTRFSANVMMDQPCPVTT
jgi:hypothetical protein